MYVYYYKDKKKNFGDDINEWLWNDLAPNTFDDSKDSWMSGIGSIIQDNMPQGRHKIIFSSGAGYGFLPDLSNTEEWKVVSVRGPLTARVLKLPESAYVTDGAILLALLKEQQPVPEEQRHGVVFMPHHGSLDYSNWEEVCKKSNIEFLSPREDSHVLLDRIRHAKLVLADAMHAAIVADVVRVPWIPISATPGTNGFKWLDWCLSMDVPFKPVHIPSSNLLEFAEQFALDMMGGSYPDGKDANEAVKFFEDRFILCSSKRANLDRKIRRYTSKALRIIFPH